MLSGDILIQLIGLEISKLKSRQAAELNFLQMLYHLDA